MAAALFAIQPLRQLRIVHIRQRDDHASLLSFRTSSEQHYTALYAKYSRAHLRRASSCQGGGVCFNGSCYNCHSDCLIVSTCDLDHRAYSMNSGVVLLPVTIFHTLDDTLECRCRTTHCIAIHVHRLAKVFIATTGCGLYGLNNYWYIGTIFEKWYRLSEYIIDVCHARCANLH